MFFSGYAKTCVLNGLKENTQHRYRVQMNLPTMSSPWSSVTEVTTMSKMIQVLDSKIRIKAGA